MWNTWTMREAVLVEGGSFCRWRDQGGEEGVGGPVSQKEQKGTDQRCPEHFP